MKVFISWSGERSRQLACALHGWLGGVIQKVVPWMSASIASGGRWVREVGDQLEATNFGVLCVTRENVKEPWLLFEAGALSKVQGSFVVPYLLDVGVADLSEPLQQFQCKAATKDGTLDLVRTINDLLGSQSLHPETLDHSFELWWPDLEKAINAIPKSEISLEPPSAERLYEVTGRDIAALRADVRQLAHLVEGQLVNRKRPNRFMGNFSDVMGSGVVSSSVASVDSVASPEVIRVSQGALESRVRFVRGNSGDEEQVAGN